MNLTPASAVIIQGITEPLGKYHAGLMKQAGTNLVAGISPGYGGRRVRGLPVFDLVEQAIALVGEIAASVIFVPPYQVLDAAREAIAANIRHLIIVTQGVPPLDMVELIRQAEATETLVLGPNSPGLMLPGQFLLGTYPIELYTPGSIGIVSRSHTLTYEVGWQLTQAGLGQSIVVGIGSDVITGSSLLQWLQILEEDPQTQAIVLAGELEGEGEERAAAYISEVMEKPLVAYIAGSAQSATSMTLTNGYVGSLRSAYDMAQQHLIDNPNDLPDHRKIKALQTANIPIALNLLELPALISQALKASLEPC